MKICHLLNRFSVPPCYKKRKPKHKQLLRLGCAALALTLTVGTVPFLLSHAAEGDAVTPSDIADKSDVETSA